MRETWHDLTHDLDWGNPNDVLHGGLIALVILFVGVCYMITSPLWVVPVVVTRYRRRRVRRE